jgi:hypothetical protein
MTRNGYLNSGNILIYKTIIVSSLIFLATALYAQSPVNFSGVWIQDTTKSDNFYKSFEVKYTIIQTLQSFKVIQTFAIKGSEEIVTRDYSFTLDGKVTNFEKEYGTEKNSVKWSADKKTLITRSIVTYGSEDVGFTETYSLSDNGLVLTAQKTDIIPGALSVKLVFNKEQ